MTSPVEFEAKRFNAIKEANNLGLYMIASYLSYGPIVTGARSITSALLIQLVEAIQTASPDTLQGKKPLLGMRVAHPPVTGPLVDRTMCQAAIDSVFNLLHAQKQQSGHWSTIAKPLGYDLIIEDTSNNRGQTFVIKLTGQPDTRPLIKTAAAVSAVSIALIVLVIAAIVNHQRILADQPTYQKIFRPQ